MMDAAPQIFRSLETNAGRDGFDAIVVAAAAAYASLRSPNDRQARDLGRLVAPLWSKVTHDTQRSVSAMLSHAPRVPRALMDVLIAAPVEISAPFLVSSPALSPADLVRLSVLDDPRLNRVLAGRAARHDQEHAVEGPDAQALPAAAQPLAAPAPSAAPSTIAEPAPFADPVADDPRANTASPNRSAGAVPRRLQSAPPLSPERLAPFPLPDAEPAATGVRQALRRLVGAGRNTRRETDAAPSRAVILQAAVNRDEDGFYGALSRFFSLSPDRLRSMMVDQTGEQLAVALKAARFGAADALSILMLVKPRIGLDVAAFERMSGFYRTLRTEDCRALLRSAATHRPFEVDTAGHRGGPEPHRSQFGRRKVRPELKARDSGA